MALTVIPIDLTARLRTRLAAVSPAAVQGVLLDVGEAGRHMWARFAQADLHTTLADYLLGLRPVEAGKDSVSIALVGLLPNLIEQGMDQLDLHMTLLGPNVPLVPRGQRGKHWSKLLTLYRHIPFRHATPGSDGLVAPRMGDLHAREFGASRGREIGRAIHKLAKELAATTSQFAAAPTGAAFGSRPILGPGAAIVGARYGGAVTRWGGRLSRDAAEAIAPKLANAVTGKEHTTSIFSSMYRFEKTYSRARQSSYGTFRTISTAPGSQGKWIRPKTPGKNFARRVAQGIAPIARQAIMGMLEAAGGVTT